MPDFPKLTLVTGGISSGKSRWAEKLVTGCPLEPVYLATAQAFDPEMVAKIARHRHDRGGAWRTVETPLALSAEIEKIVPGEIVLVDCLTMWLSNHLLQGSDLAGQVEHLLRAIDVASAPIILVSNEVGQGGISDNALARRFHREQGRLNQRIAARADLVVAVMSGLPMVLKGVIPKDVT